MATLIRSASIGSVVLDASVNEMHTDEMEVTDHPVERGVNITDHSRKKPATIQIEGVISNTPIPKPNDPLTQRTAAGGVKFSSRGQLNETLVADAYQALLKLQADGTLVQVVTSLRTYDNMLLKTLSAPRDARTGQVLRFNALLVEIKVVNSQTVKVSDTKKNVPLGKKAATPTPAAERRGSTLKKAADTKAGDGFLKGIGLR